jgi:hypothetical protein
MDELTRSSMWDTEAMFVDGAEIFTDQKLLAASLAALRGALRGLSPVHEPERWAGVHLMLGWALRLRGRHVGEGERARLYLEAIEAFEAALAVYCQTTRMPRRESDAPGLSIDEHTVGRVSSAAMAASEGSAEPDSQQHRVTSNPRGRGNDPDLREVCTASNSKVAMSPMPREDGVDLLLEATRSVVSADTHLLQQAAHVFRECCTRTDRRKDFRIWAANMSNLGCALTLLGRCAPGADGVTQLETAVDLFRDVLKEPILREMSAECAAVHINLADALQTLATRAMPTERLRYIESALDALSAALSIVAPAKYGGLSDLQHAALT